MVKEILFPSGRPGHGKVDMGDGWLIFNQKAGTYCSHEKHVPHLLRIIFTLSLHDDSFVLKEMKISLQSILYNLTVGTLKKDAECQIICDQR